MMDSRAAKSALKQLGTLNPTYTVSLIALRRKMPLFRQEGRTIARVTGRHNSLNSGTERDAATEMYFQDQP